jgi:DNA-binding response OmpR family regulator
MPDRILVIDDDLDSLKLIGLMLQRQGYQVSAAAGGTQGLAQAESERPDLILLDIMMPDIDGYELCRRLKSDPRLARIPVIIFSAKTSADDKIAGFEAGADDYLTKPTHPTELASRIKTLLARSTIERSAPPSKPRGAVVTILGVRGGAGTTTLALNLSALLAQQETRVILGDLQHGAGMVSYALGFSQGAGLSHLLALDIEELTQDKVERQFVAFAPGLQLLLAEYRPGESLTSAMIPHVERVVEILTQLADLVIIDLGNKPGRALFNMLRRVDQILICMAPERISIRLAQNLLDRAEQSGIDRNRFSCVLMNTTPLMPPYTLQATESHLGLRVLGNIASAPELARLADEQAKPMVTVRPESPTAAQFRQVSERLMARLDRTHS